MITFFSKLLLLAYFPFGFYAQKTENKHPFHVSTTEVNTNLKDKTLEVTSRIFTDDFETALANKFKTKIDLHKDEKKMAPLVKKYVEDCLKFTVNGKLTKLNYIGYENDHEATNVYFEIDNANNANDLKQLTLKNVLLYDLFDDQMNILHVSKNGNRKSTKVNYPDAQMSISF